MWKINKSNIKKYLLSSISLCGFLVIFEIFADLTSKEGIDSLRHYLIFACKAVPVVLLICYFLLPPNKKQ